MTALPMPTESIATVDLLLGRATMLIADQFDNVAQAIQEALGISLLMAASHPAPGAVDVPGLDRLDALECVEHALREVHSWNLGLAVELPDLARLCVLLADVRRDLAGTTGRRG